jgi:hypothetical protein
LKTIRNIGSILEHVYVLKCVLRLYCFLLINMRESKKYPLVLGSRSDPVKSLVYSVIV